MSKVETNQVKIKLPSISELTSKAPPGFEGFRDLSSVPSGAAAAISTTPSNYILSGPSPRIPSPTNSFYEQKYQQHVPIQPFHQHIQYYQLPQPQYYQPIYIQPQQLPSPPTVPATQYMIPEVINKPVNKCHRCGATETPEWRRGPNGVRTLCNACGLFHAKLVKRKGAALAAEEVLNNKVCKGKNGRRIAIKKKIIANNIMPKDIKSMYKISNLCTTNESYN